MVIELKKDKNKSYFTSIDDVEVEHSRSNSYIIAFNDYCRTIEENYFGEMPNGVLIKTQIS